MKKDIDISQDPIQFWYPMLWKKKIPFRIYHIHDAFFGRCRSILIITIPGIITQEAKYFLEGKGLLYLDEENSYIRLFSFDETPFLFGKFIID